MSDTSGHEKPNFHELFLLASTQHGHFTTAQAHACGFQDSLLSYHSQTGKFVRVHRGVYRLRDYPSSQYEEIVAAWLAIGKEIAVVSHESALQLLELSDVSPSKFHFTVPRARRNMPSPPLTAVHTSTRPFEREEIIERQGIRVTAPERAIVDAAERGTAPEQIELAVRDSLDRGLTTPRMIMRAAASRGRYVRELIGMVVTDWAALA